MRNINIKYYYYYISSRFVSLLVSSQTQWMSPKKSFLFVPVIFHFKNKPEIRDENVHLAQIVFLTEILENAK